MVNVCLQNKKERACTFPSFTSCRAKVKGFWLTLDCAQGYGKEHLASMSEKMLHKNTMRTDEDQASQFSRPTFQLQVK
jgi:hypothetical protein